MKIFVVFRFILYGYFVRVSVIVFILFSTEYTNFTVIPVVIYMFRIIFTDERVPLLTPNRNVIMTITIKDQVRAQIHSAVPHEP